MQDLPLGELSPEVGLGLVFLAFAGVFAFLIFFWIISIFLVICKPNEVLVISGRSHRLPDGSTVGYKVLHGGRGLRIPVLEEVNRMDMRLIPVQVEVENAYSKGGIPLQVHAIANVKIASDPTSHPQCDRARAHDVSASDRHDCATDPGRRPARGGRRAHARGGERRSSEFADTLMKHAKDDFDKLGLELDVLKVQSVSDEGGYLNNLGRARIARMIRDAQNAENSANQTIAEAQATARQRAESAQKQAEALVLTKRNQLRAELANFEAEAKSIENEAEVAAQTARSEAEQELQAMRADLEKLRLECDVFLPAEAQRLASEAQARGSAAPVVEQGRAAAEALTMVAQAWQGAGRDGRDLYVLQHLKEMVEAAVSRVAGTTIAELSVVDGGDGRSFTGAVASFPAAVAQVLAETGRAIGVDVSRLIQGSDAKGRDS